MISLWVAFITGVTTGGLSCMAVQGGLLASSLASQIEKDMVAQGNKRKGKTKPHIALPIALFLVSKLLVYTLLGFLLGAIGSVLQLTPLMRAIMQFAIGVFMIGNGLRMLNVHPIFRYFTFEPPSSLTRFIRRKAKNSTSLFTPILLGALTVFIPCGVAQTMMAAAVASGSPVLGAALLFSFTLGTSPVFFALSYLATRLSAVLEKQFVRIVAVFLLVLGLLAIDTGLNLVGFPYSITRMVQNAPFQITGGVPVQAESGPQPVPAQSAEKGTLVLNVVNSGYEPQVLHSPANMPIKLNLVTDNTTSCSRAFVIPELNMQELLPGTGTVVLDIPAQAPGKVIAFTCSMGMYTGEIVFDQ